MAFLWAYPSTDGGQEATLFKDVDRLFIVVVGDGLNEAGNIDAYRAAGNAGGLRAHEATLAFEKRVFFPVAQRHFGLVAVFGKYARKRVRDCLLAAT